MQLESRGRRLEQVFSEIGQLGEKREYSTNSRQRPEEKNCSSILATWEEYCFFKTDKKV